MGLLVERPNSPSAHQLSCAQRLDISVPGVSRRSRQGLAVRFSAITPSVSKQHRQLQCPGSNSLLRRIYSDHTRRCASILQVLTVTEYQLLLPPLGPLLVSSEAIVLVDAQGAAKRCCEDCRFGSGSRACWLHVVRSARMPAALQKQAVPA